MAVCGRCFLCSRKFECVAGRGCSDSDGCAGPEAAPATISAPWMPDGWKVCRSCVTLLGTTAIGDAVASLLRYGHARNGEST